MIVDGKQIAEEIIVGLGETLHGTTLGLVVGESDVATESFVRIKSRAAERLGVRVVRGTLGEVSECDGIIIQLPHPDAATLITSLPPEKDVDAVGLHPMVFAPVAGAIAEILIRTGVDPRGKTAAVVGAGKLVGVPAAALLRELGAEVAVITQTHGSLGALSDADIVILGAGEPNLIKPGMLKRGVVLIDAGTSEQGGRLSGDADPACAEVSSVFTPVPGGVGPIAVAMIFKNLFDLVDIKNSGI